MSGAESKTASAPTQVGYTRLGKSGLRISRIILGFMSYGAKEWAEWVISDQEECDEHVRKTWEHGINTFDTANMYSQGLSEVMLGRSLKKLDAPRAAYVILTKLYMPVKAGQEPGGGRPPVGADELDAAGFVNQRGLSRKHIFDSVQDSLKRLDTDYIDLLQCHRFDYDTPIEETMQALHDVVQKGWVRYIGMSSCFAHQFWAMQTYAISNRLTPFISMQNYHNLVYREEEREMVPTLAHFGCGMIPWSPLARGFLTRPLTEATSTTRSGGSDHVYAKWANTSAAANDEINKRVEKVAKDIGGKTSMAQVALAWSLSKEFISAPIVGTTKLDNLLELVEGTKLELTQEQIKFLEEPYVPQAVKGHV